MEVTLTGMLDPSRPIVAIKCLRCAIHTEDGRPFGLADAKRVVDGLRDGKPFTLDADPVALAEAFSFVQHPGEGIPRDLVTDFVLDVLAWCDPETARRIMAMPSYRRVKEAL